MGGSSGSVPKVWRLYTTEEIQNSPSRPFMTLEKENLTRKQHTKLIKSAGQELKFSQTAGPVVVGAACTFFHRYFMMKSFAHNDPLIFAAASLFLACKTEDNPRALQDIYFTMFKLRYGKSHPDIVRKLQANKPFVEELRDTILTAERALMYTLGFEFEYIHPFKYYSEVLAGMGLKEEQMQPGTPQAIISSIMDANLSSVLLMGTSRHLCAAATQFILVNVGKHQIPLVEGKPWYVAFEPAAPELIPNIVTEMGRWYTIRPTAARTSRAVASHTAESAGPTPTSQPAAPVKRPALPGSQQHTSASAPPAQARRDDALTIYGPEKHPAAELLPAGLFPAAA
ncbi:hypothetical protein WJX72_001586 [[Myrmecia] bisecta]|uniref:Cyclin-like domain-containing protein n=1 Tax=[Myrmecia] bisecta TaxID=41462 RepID=A0AAW1PCT2_9CHLO